MPLLDHFRPPLYPTRHWESFHVNWAGAMADALNEGLLPDGYFAEEHAKMGARVEIDVATFDTHLPTTNGSTATLTARPLTWAPPAPALIVPAAFPDRFEVLVFREEGDAELVAAIEILSPANKDREAHRRAFAIKCASYLVRGVSLVAVDIVASRRAAWHRDILTLIGHDGPTGLADDEGLCAVAYRPVVRGDSQIDVWPQALAVGEPLPTVPLALDAETCLPLDLDATYAAACQRRRLP